MDTSGGSHDRRAATLAANKGSLDRLAHLAHTLDAERLRARIGDWTVSALLYHVAFWDRFVAERWRHALASGTHSPEGIPDFMTDALNDTLRPLLSAMPIDQAGAFAVEAARDIDGLLEGLEAGVIEELWAAGRSRLVDRSIHRLEHVAEIERKV